MPSRSQIGLDLTIDGTPAGSETSYTWAGAHVLTVHTVIPGADLAIELHSTFVGHPRIGAHVSHLRLGPIGSEPAIASGYEAQLDPTLEPRGCAYEHAQRLIEVLSDLGYRGAVHVPDEAAFAALERIGTRVA